MRKTAGEQVIFDLVFSFCPCHSESFFLPVSQAVGYSLPASVPNLSCGVHLIQKIFGNRKRKHTHSKMDWLNPSTLFTIVAVCLVAWIVQLITFSPISPSPNYFLPDYKREGPFAENNVLQTIEKLGEGLLYHPEDSAVDSNGMIYTATKDGWIKRMHTNGSWEDWKKIGGSPLGLTVSKLSGHILVCDPARGLLDVSDEGVSIITSEIEGIKIRFVDAIVESSDGSLYFSDASTKFSYEKWVLDFLEGVPYGRLLKYDPKTKKTSVMLQDLAFANGVALSQNEDYVVICETWKFRCLKHWIKGDKLGKTEILVENLPGSPDNINLAPDGRSFWVALVKSRTKALDFVFSHPVLRRIFASNPVMLEWLGFLRTGALVAQIGEDGQILRSFGDLNGKIISFVTSAMQVGDSLYIGSLSANFLGRLYLN